MKKGKKAKDLIVLAVDEADFEAMKNDVLIGEFRTGRFFVCLKERQEELMEIIQAIPE